MKGRSKRVERGISATRKRWEQRISVRKRLSELIERKITGNQLASDQRMHYNEEDAASAPFITEEMLIEEAD